MSKRKKVSFSVSSSVSKYLLVFGAFGSLSVSLGDVGAMPIQSYQVDKINYKIFDQSLAAGQKISKSDKIAIASNKSLDAFSILKLLASNIVNDVRDDVITQFDDKDDSNDGQNDVDKIIPKQYAKNEVIFDGNVKKYVVKNINYNTNPLENYDIKAANSKQLAAVKNSSNDTILTMDLQTLSDIAPAGGNAYEPNNKIKAQRDLKYAPKKAKETSVTAAKIMKEISEQLQIIDSEIYSPVKKTYKVKLVGDESPIKKIEQQATKLKLQKQKIVKKEFTDYDLIQSVPANGLPQKERSIYVVGDIKIDRNNSVNPFSDDKDLDNKKASDIIETSDGNVLHLAVNDGQNIVQKNISLAYDALVSGQLEASIHYYKEVLKKEPKNKDALFGLATSYHVGGQFTEAKEYYMKLINIDSKNYEALNNFLVLVSEEQGSNAIATLNDLKNNNVEFAPIHAHLGFLYLKSGDYKKALSSLEDAVERDPSNNSYKYSAALILEYLGDYNGAARIYNHLLSTKMTESNGNISRQKIIEHLEFAMGRMAFSKS